MARYRAASAMAPIPFDRHGVPGTIELVDDFVTAEAAAAGAMVSELPWLITQVAGDSGGNVTLGVPVANHQGIAVLETGATTPADGDIAALELGASASASENFILDTNGLYIAAVLDVPDVDAQKVEFGLAGQAIAAVNSSALNIVSWVWDPEDAANVGDAFFIAQVNGAGTDVEQVSTVSYVESDWVLLEIAADSTSATFRLTTEDNTETFVLDGTDGTVMPIVALRPFISVEAVGAAEEVTNIDLFACRYIRRQALVADWLGA